MAASPLARAAVPTSRESSSSREEDSDAQVAAVVEVDDADGNSASSNSVTNNRGNVSAASISCGDAETDDNERDEDDGVDASAGARVGLAPLVTNAMRVGSEMIMLDFSAGDAGDANGEPLLGEYEALP